MQLRLGRCRFGRRGVGGGRRHGRVCRRSSNADRSAEHDGKTAFRERHLCSPVDGLNRQTETRLEKTPASLRLTASRLFRVVRLVEPGPGNERRPSQKIGTLCQRACVCEIMTRPFYKMIRTSFCSSSFSGMIVRARSMGNASRTGRVAWAGEWDRIKEGTQWSLPGSFAPRRPCRCPARVS